MAAGQDLIELKFRLIDVLRADLCGNLGSLSPRSTSLMPSSSLEHSDTVAESDAVVWKVIGTRDFGSEKENGPRTINDLKLINAGKILENNRTLADSRNPVGELPGGLITMHVVVRPPIADKKNVSY
ncbi:hypothetical protein C1H46_004763 [Malus baccata]|uniref:UBL3-like ubiquitin domain-containing protein n=1 Tax=Malus baccata TaxID=106549 RepID=A0A540NGL6_MALBA|nr:hypothetical protein C1H46_004763 [Malus baccata]